ncbi:MAG: tetratricopeptide repeat protein [Vampirovibrio sp.]|nr:tetratricopeptide repeat protein [Vampirovibrio sp.]
MGAFRGIGKLDLLKLNRSVFKKQQQQAACLLLLFAMTAIPAYSAVNVDGYIRQGSRYYQQGYIQKAIPAFEQAVKRSPNNEAANLWLARALMKQGGQANSRRAQSILNRILSTNADHPEALMTLGTLYSWNEATHGKSIPLLRAALAQPADPYVKAHQLEGTKTLVSLLVWKNQLDEARRYADPIIKAHAPALYKDKMFTQSYVSLLNKTDRSQEALPLLTRYLSADKTTNVQIKQEYAVALYNTQHPQQAKAIFKSLAADLANAKMPQSKRNDLTLSLAGLAYQLEAYESAVALDQSLPENLRQQQDVQLRMARSYAKAGRVSEAVDAFERLYQADQLTAEEKLEYGDYLTNLALPVNTLPSPDRPETLYKEAFENPAYRGYAYLRLARLYGKNGNRYTDAVDHYQQALRYAKDGTTKLRIRHELGDLLITDKLHRTESDAVFQTLLDAEPTDILTVGKYADFLSWQEDRRTRSIELFYKLARRDELHQDKWVTGMERVLGWHTPSESNIPLYQEILTAYPNSKGARLSLARLYLKQPGRYGDGVAIYRELMAEYPEDKAVRQDWMGVLLADEDHRTEALKALSEMVDQYPNDLTVVTAYAKLLSYERKYGKALKFFDQALNQNNEYREALVGKGYTLLWSGRPLSAKKHMAEVRDRYPNDVEVALALAAAEKGIGRYDKALDILDEIRRKGIDPAAFQQNLPRRSGSNKSFMDGGLGTPVRLLADSVVIKEPVFGSKVKSPVRISIDGFWAQEDFHTQNDQNASPAAKVKQGNQASSVVNLNGVPGVKNALQPQVSPIEDILKQNPTQEVIPLDMQADVVQDKRWMVVDTPVRPSEGTEIPSTETFSLLTTEDESPHYVGVQNPAYQGGLFKEDVLSGAYQPIGMQQQASLYEEDNQSLLAGRGRMFHNEISRLEGDIANDLRPSFRIGYLYSTQQGEKTTNQLSSTQFPNQLSFSLTPQIRVRGGISPRRFYIPNTNVFPRNSAEWQYSLGFSAQLFDRLRTDVDIALDTYSQSDTKNVTFQVKNTYAVNDNIDVKFGSRRIPLENSLLSYTGLQPNAGAF